MKEATPVNVLGSAGSIPTVKHRALGGAAGAPPLTASRYQSHGGKHTGHLAQDGARLPSWQDETESRSGVRSALHDHTSRLSRAATKGPHPLLPGEQRSSRVVMPLHYHNKGTHLESETGKMFPHKVASPAPAVRTLHLSVRTLHLSVSKCADPRPLSHGLAGSGRGVRRRILHTPDHLLNNWDLGPRTPSSHQSQSPGLHSTEDNNNLMRTLLLTGFS